MPALPACRPVTKAEESAIWAVSLGAASALRVKDRGLGMSQGIERWSCRAHAFQPKTGLFHMFLWERQAA